MNKTAEQLLFTLKPDKLGQENFENENDYTTLTDVEFNLISPVTIAYDKKSEIVTRINEINNELDFINCKVEELNLEIDNLTNHADGLDYTFAVISGIIAGIVDNVFIGEWNFEKAKAITNKEVNGKVLKFAKKDARYASWCRNTAYGRKERDPNRLETAIEFLEEHYHLPGDSAYQTGNYGVTGNAHRLDDFCHHPTLIGLLCSVIVQFTGSTVYSHSGELIRIPISVNRYGNFVGNNNFTKLMAGVINWFISIAKAISNHKGHLMSDIATSTGIPGPLLSTLKELSILPCLKDKMFCDNLRKAYQNGIGIGENQIDLGAFNCIFDGASNEFDKRTEMAVTHELKRQSIPLVINEALVRGFYFIRRFIEQMKVKKNISQLDWKSVLPLKNRTITRMLTISTGTLMAFDLADAGIRAVVKSRGVNPKTLEKFVLSVNFVGIGRFAVAVTTDVVMGVKKNILENERIILQCKKLNLLNAKVAYEQGEVFLAAIETEEEMEKLFEIANNAKRIFCDVYNNIDTNINSIKSLVKSIDKNNLKTYSNILESRSNIMDILTTNDIKPLNTENINNLDLTELPRKIGEQYENIKHLEEKVQDAMERAQEARSKASNANVKIGIFKYSKKEAIKLLQKAAEGNAEALLSSVESQKLLFEYQKKLTVITEELFGFCTFNIALTDASIDSITNLLKGAAEDDLSDLAQDELKKLLYRLKQKRSEFKEREKLGAEINNLSRRVERLEKHDDETKKEEIYTDIVQKDNSKKNCIVSKDKPLKNKNKIIAGLLAIFLGFFGIHWFYLCKPIRAIIYMAVYFICPFIWLLYIVEGLFFFFCKKETFDSYRSKW